MTRRSWVRVLAISALMGAAIWALSPLISGYTEPWDAKGHYYPVVLAIAGFMSGVIGPRVRWAFFTGAVAGQVIFMAASAKIGPLALVGFAFVCIYSLIFLAAAISATYLRDWVVASRTPG